MIPFGRMVAFATWEKFIRASSGSDAMKDRIVALVDEHVRDGDLLDSFKLGFVLGRFSRSMSGQELSDFRETIFLTRDTNNVPIVQVDGKPVS